MNLYRSFSVLSVAWCVSACADFSGNGVSLGLGVGGMLGNHVGIGTSVQVPLQKKPNQNIDELTMPVIYFDASGSVSDAPSKGGYRRKILAKQNDALYLVQDFYEMGGSKRSEPMPLNANQLNQWHAKPNNGAYIIYAPNGNVLQQQIFQNGQIVP